MAKLCPGELMLIECTTRTHIPARKGEGRAGAKCHDSPFHILFLLGCAASRNSTAQASILIVNMYVLLNETLPVVGGLCSAVVV